MARLLFAGTPDFAVPALQALIAQGHPPVAVYTQPDRPAGRGRKLQPSPVKETALTAGLAVEQPVAFKDAGALERLRDYRAELLIVIAYGLILPPAVLEAPVLGCLNIHGSLLPRWRGAAPIQRALLAGDAQTGVELMQMDAGLDTGPVFARRVTDIEPRETARSLHDRLAALGAELLLEQLPAILAGQLQPQPQPEVGACYAHKLTKEEARIDWTRSASDIDRQIRAFNPWPIAHTRLGEDVIRLWAAHPDETCVAKASGTPGQILGADRQGLLVATGGGLLRVTELQPPGKRAMSAADFSHARSLDGVHFG
jgi:methionyl-tRNA formyltransferase